MMLIDEKIETAYKLGSARKLEKNMFCLRPQAYSNTHVGLDGTRLLLGASNLFSLAI